MVISKKDLKNPENNKIKYDNTSEASGKLIDQKYVDINKFDEMELHETDEQARKANAEKVERHKDKQRIIY